MMESEMLQIKVPASTANLGPGFDSIGLSLSLYLELQASPVEKWEVIPLSEELKAFPADESNFIIATALQVAKQYNKELPPCRVTVASEIPLARGLGSSASAIVAAIELADALGELCLTKEEKFIIATNMEGHPDNVGASIFGGLVVGCQLGEEADVEVIHSVDLELLAIIPNEELLTKAARDVLPAAMPFAEAVAAGAVSNLLVAALLTGNDKLAGKMMSLDKYHQPYRKQLVPHLELIEKEAPLLGAYGVALSGAGPTVLCFIEKGKTEAVKAGLQKLLPGMSLLPVEMDKEGAVVKGKSYTSI